MTRTISSDIKTTCSRCSTRSGSKSSVRTPCSECTPRSSQSSNTLQLKTSRGSPRRYCESRTLHTIINSTPGNDRAIDATLKTVFTTASSPEMRLVQTKRPAVQLLKADPAKNVPSIWLDHADGTAPTMHVSTWTVLEFPHWGANKVFVCVEKLPDQPVHKKSADCDDCVAAGWVNIRAQLMLQGWSDAMGKTGEGEDAWKWKVEGGKRAEVKRALRRAKRYFGAKEKRSVRD